MSARRVEPETGLRRVPVWYWLVLLLAGAAAYANSLHAPKVLDDVVSIDQNPQIRDLSSVAVLLPERELPLAGRPLPNLTLAINYALHGTTGIAGYRVVNLLFHLLCGLMIVAVVRRILTLPANAARWPGDPSPIAFAAALVWLLHPLNSEVVNYITQRTESMMALAYLATLYASLRALDARGLSWTAAAIVACALGTLCKESMATAPVVVALFDRVFVFRTWREAWRTRARLYLGLASSWVLLGVILASGPRVYSTGFNAGVSAWTYLLNQAVMIVRYLRLMIWPDALVVYYGHPLPVTLMDVLPAALLVVALVGATVAALRFRPWLGFAGAWFFITLAPTSSIVPIVTEVGAERRMYLPLLAIVVPLCVAAARIRIPSRVLAVALVVLVVVLGTRTVARNREYLSPLTLAEVTLARWPTGSTHHMVGEQLLFAGRLDEALPHLREAIRDTPKARYTLGMLLYKEGQHDPAIEQLQAFIDAEPRLLEVPDAHITIGSIHAGRQRWDEAERELRSATVRAPRNPRAWSLLADVLLKQQKAADAIPAYAVYVTLQPRDVDAWTNLGFCLAVEGRLSEAINAFSRAVELKPDDGQTHRNLATALLDAGRVGEGERAARRAVELRPDDRVARELLAQALARRRKRS